MVASVGSPETLSLPLKNSDIATCMPPSIIVRNWGESGGVFQSALIALRCHRKVFIAWMVGVVVLGALGAGGFYGYDKVSPSIWKTADLTVLNWVSV